jgi:hypothetical protein
VQIADNATRGEQVAAVQVEIRAGVERRQQHCPRPEQLGLRNTDDLGGASDRRVLHFSTGEGRGEVDALFRRGRNVWRRRRAGLLRGAGC